MTASCGYVECDELVEQAHTGRRRLYCSARCRRLANRIRAACPDCGIPTWQDSPGSPRPRCEPCNRAHLAAYQAELNRPHRDAMAAAAAAGATDEDLAARFGYATRASAQVAVHRLRHLYGYAIPDRRTMNSGRRRPA